MGIHRAFRPINLPLFKKDRKCRIASVSHGYIVDVLRGQPIKLAKVASTSNLRENYQRNDLLFFKIVPCHFCGASEVQTLNRS